MKIVVNHLTRMQKGFMCVAGIDLQSQRHVRPMLRRQMRIDMLARHGGPFEMGSIVDLGRIKMVGRPPEVEDTLFWPEQARAHGSVSAADFWSLLVKHARPRLIDIFGPQLEKRGSHSCVMPVGQGRASLGLFRPVSPRLFVERFDGRQRIRMAFRSGEHEFTTPVTDIRLYREDHITPDERIVTQINQQLSAADVILSVGLSRPFRKAASDPPLHWLQVNNLHFADQAIWRLG